VITDYVRCNTISIISITIQMKSELLSKELPLRSFIHEKSHLHDWRDVRSLSWGRLLVIFPTEFVKFESVISVVGLVASVWVGVVAVVASVASVVVGVVAVVASVVWSEAKIFNFFYLFASDPVNDFAEGTS